MKNIIAIIMAAASLTGCTPSIPVSRDVITYRDDYVRYQMSFHKHPSGLCFAVVTYDRSMSITDIPCQRGDTTFVK